MTYSFTSNLVYRSFHTSSPRHIHPLIWIFLKPALKGVAWITGRSTRKWYRQLPPEKRSVFVQHLVRNKYRYFGIFGTIGTAVAIHYYTHLETVPITGRKRYMLFNAEKFKSFFDMNRDTIAEDHHQRVLPETSSETQFVARVARRILAANMDIPSISTIKWSIRVINTDKENGNCLPWKEIDDSSLFHLAFVLPSGDIYVYRGWLKMMKNEDQVAATIGHELAHAILGHSAEKLSRSQMIDSLAILGAFVIWTIFPSDWTSFCVNYIFDKFIQYSARLPHSRHMEEEADQVGLMLAAKACYDVRTAVDIWEALRIREVNREISEYRSTHPSHANRVENLTKLLAWAVDLRLQHKCDALPAKTLLDVQNIFTDDTKKKTNVVTKHTSDPARKQ